MKVETNKLKKGSSELTLECRQLIDKINKCNGRTELQHFLETINVWIYGKCELFHWIEILDRFDLILEEAASKDNGNEFLLNCDTKLLPEDIRLLLLVLNFTTLLIEHSFSRHLYNSTEHLTQLLSSRNMDIVLAVLNLLYMFSKRSNFIPRLPFEKKEILLIKLYNIAERWGDPNYGLALIDCCLRKPKLEYLYQLFVEYVDENGQIAFLEIPDMMDLCKNSSPSEIVCIICNQMSNPSYGVKMRIAHRAHLVAGFKDYKLRLKFVQARLQAVSVLIYSNALHENIDKVLYSGFGEELCELIDKEDIQLVEIRAAVLRTLTSMLHFDRNPNVSRPGSRLPKIIQYTGAERQSGILPLLVRDCISSLTGEGPSAKYPLILATSLFSLLYHLASYESGGQALVKSGMMQSLLRVINWNGEDVEHITFVTRAVRVIDLITNIDIGKFHQHNGLNIFIDRLDKEIKNSRIVISNSINKKNESNSNDTKVLKSDTIDEHGENKLDESVQHFENNDGRYLGNMNVNNQNVNINVTPESKNNINDSKSLQDITVNDNETVRYPLNSYYSRHISERNLESKIHSLKLSKKKQTCVTQRAALLKSMLNFLKKSIQDHAHFNGMRNIMESTLPSSLRHIISNAEYYGPSLFLLATDVVTVYVFNEPSLLSSLQDLGITNVILHSLLQKDVPATREVLGSLPNVFSALCLNERGLMEFMSYDPFDKLLKVLLSPDYLIAMRRRRSSDPLGDTATNLGNAMDDLMKHHPYLRTDAMEAIVRLLNELVRLGSEPNFICWRANKEYGSSHNNASTRITTNINQNDALCVIGNNENQNDSSGEDDDDDEEISSASQQPQSQNRSSLINSSDHSTSSQHEREAIPLIDYILNVMKFIEAIFSNSSNGEHCREFIIHGGLKPLLNILSMANLPVDSPISTTAQAVANVCKSILSLTHETVVIDTALKQLSGIVITLKPLTKHFSFPGGSVLLKELLNCPKIEDGFSIADYTPLLHGMSSVHGYVVMLVHLCRNSSNEMRSMLLKRWGNNCETGLILLKNLVTLYISLVWESTILLSLCSEESSNINLDLNWDNTYISNIEDTKDVVLKKKKQNFKYEDKIRYIKSLLAASSRLGRALAELFGTLVKLSVGNPQSRQRRNNEYITSISSSKFPTPDSKEIARVLSSILVNGFQHEKTIYEPVPKLKLTFLICSVGFTGPMLFDDKRNSFHLMISQFCEENGLKAFFDMFYWALSLNSGSSPFSFEQCCAQENILENIKDDTIDFPEGTGEFLDAWLQLLEKMINPRAVLESPYSISTRLTHEPEAVQFEPIFYLIQMHRLAIQTIRRIWKKKPIPNFGVSMTETIITILKHIIKSHAMLCEKYQSRKIEMKNCSKVIIQCKKSLTPLDESNVNCDHLKMLIDMGFIRPHVLEALRNTRSLEQATEYLLSHSESENIAPLSTGNSNSFELNVLNSRATNSDMDIESNANTATELPCTSSNTSKCDFKNINLISYETFNKFCMEVLNRSFAFMEYLPETVSTGAEIIYILYRQYNQSDKQAFIYNLVKKINERVENTIESLKKIDILNCDKFEEFISGTIAKTLLIRFKVSTLLLNEMYADIRKEFCAAIFREQTLNYLLTLLKQTESIMHEQVTLSLKPISPSWLQTLIEFIDTLDNVSIILQRKANMTAVSSEMWKWYDASTGKWNPYSETNNLLIKNAFNAGERSVFINIGRQRYTVNFNCMTQVSEASGNHRPVLPVLKISQALSILSSGNTNNKIENILTTIVKSKADGKTLFYEEDQLSLNYLINFDTNGSFDESTLPKGEETVPKFEKTQTSKVAPNKLIDVDLMPNDINNARKLKNEKRTSGSPLKRVQKILLTEENVGLAIYNRIEIMTCLVRLLEPKLLLSFDTKLSILKLCARLTRDYDNAKLFFNNGGLNLLLNMHQPCNLMSYPTYAIVIIRHILEAPSVLQESIERIISARTSNSIPVGHRDLIFLLTQVSSAVARHPTIFLSAAKQTLHADYLNNPKLSLDDSRFLVKSQVSTQRKYSSSLNENLENEPSMQISTKVIKDLLNALIQPCIHYGDDSNDDRTNQCNGEAVESIILSTEGCSITSTKKSTEKIEPCCCSWHVPSNGHTHQKPSLPRSTLMKILADAIRSYQSLVPRIVIDHICSPADSALIKKEQSFISYILDNFLPIVNKQQDSEVSMMSRVIISSLSECYGQTYVQTKIVEEIQDAIIRSLLLKDCFIKNVRLQVLISLFPMMIENPMQTNKIQMQRNNMYRILLRKGIMTILSKLTQYKDLSNSNTLTTMYAILKPMEMLLRLTVAPGSFSSKRIFINTVPNSNVNRRIFPRLTTPRLASTSGSNSIGGENVLRDIIRNVLSDRRHGLDFVFNADELFLDSEDEGIRAIGSNNGAENDENVHDISSSNHRPQVNFDRLWDDLLQNENLRLINRNTNINNISSMNNIVPVNTRLHNSTGESTNNDNRGNGGSDGASTSSDIAAAVAENTASLLAEVSTSESESDSNVSSENDDPNEDDDDDNDDEDEDDGNEDGVEDRSETDADDETRQFIEVFDHIYEPESSETASNDADIDADDEASEVGGGNTVVNGLNASSHNDRTLETSNSIEPQISTDVREDSTATTNATVSSVNTYLSEDNVHISSSINNINTNISNNLVRSTTSSVWAPSRVTLIGMQGQSNYREHFDEEMSDNTVTGTTNNDRIEQNTIAAPTIHISSVANNTSLFGSNGQRREQSRRLVHLDQQYCVSMPSILNPLEEGQIEVFNQDALHWWLEEAKHLDLESQTDACLYVGHFLIPFLIKQLKQSLIKRKSELSININNSSNRRSAIPVLIQQTTNMSHSPEPTDTAPVIDISSNLNNISLTGETLQEPLQSVQSELQVTSATSGPTAIEHRGTVQTIPTRVPETVCVSRENENLIPSDLNIHDVNRNEPADDSHPTLNTETIDSDQNSISESIIDNSVPINTQIVSTNPLESNEVLIQNRTSESSTGFQNMILPNLTEEQSSSEMSPEVRAALGDLVVPEGVDPSFLAALPADMREEVIQEHLRMQRVRQRAQQNAVQVTHDSLLEVNPEFLAALPPNIQSEVLLQQRIEQQRQAAQSVNPNDPVDTAAFFQNLPESLRQTILTDMEESQISSLPPDLAAEAQYLRRDWETRNSGRLDGIQSNTLGGYLSTRLPSSLQNINDESRWHMNSIWYDPNGTPQAHHNRHTAFHHQQINGKPIALILMEDENNLLDPDSLTTILLLLFIEDSKNNLTRLHRVVRNLCYHLPTREWIINALISIIQKTNEGTISYSCKNGVKPQWLKLRVDAAFGYKSNIFVINQAKESSENSLQNDYCISVNPQAAQMIVKNCLDMLFVLAKHFPTNFLPFNRLNNSQHKNLENNPAADLINNLHINASNSTSNDLKTIYNRTNSSHEKTKSSSHSKQTEFKNDDSKLDDFPSTSKAAAVRNQHKNNSTSKNKFVRGIHYTTNSECFWDVLLNIDLKTQQRLSNVQTFPLNSYPEWKWESKTQDFISFNESPFAKLLEMLPYKGICRSPQLTDMLVKLLALLSSDLPREDDGESIDEQLLSNVIKNENKNKKISISNNTKSQENPIKANRKIYSKNFSQLQLVIEVLTHQCGTIDGLDNISKLIVNFSQCSQASNAIFLQYLVAAILGLAQDVRNAIQNLLTEIQTYNNESPRSSSNVSGVKTMHSLQPGIMQDRFTSENIIISIPTNIKPTCELQLPAMKKLLSSSSAQPYFLRTLKIYMQVRDLFEFHDASILNNENKKPTLSQIICLDDLWDTLSECLVALENSKDEYAVLVLQPSVEAFFLIHASQKKKTNNKANIENSQIIVNNGEQNNSIPNANIFPSHVNSSSEESECASITLLNTDSPKNDKYETQTSEITQELQHKMDRTKFLSFAEKHRKVLNQILRQTSTHLSDGPFGVLVNHTRILDFDVKRKYFQTELERIDEGVRREENTVSVRRITVFEDSFRVLYRLGPEEWKNRFYIVFEDEEGQDAGGLLREWYVIISREIFNPMYALFCVSPGDRVTYMINPSSHANPNHLSYFKFVGRVIAKAIHDNKLLECYFTRSFYKHILGKQVKYTDMESQDYEFYKGLDYLMKFNISTLGYELTFSTEVQEFGVTKIRDLIPNGRNIAVTEENKFEYVQLVCQLKMSDSIRQQLNAFLEGFYDIIPKHLISIFNEQELELLISGLPDIDIEDLKANTEYHKYTSKSVQIQWFWRALRSFDQADRAKFLQFVTGTSKVPLQGFSSLEGMNGIQKFQIHRDDRSTDRLPCAHTCFNQLDLPMYKSYEKLRSSLLKAIHECSEGFGFA